MREVSDAIAIDFGTTRTKVAYWHPNDNRARMMHFQRYDPFVPSLFYLFRDSTRILWGHDAEAMRARDPVGVIDVLKRRLRETAVRANRRRVKPTDLLAFFFHELRAKAGREIAVFNGTPPEGVYLTLPALYGPPDEQLLREAAIKAGFNEKIMQLVAEPVAAGQAWLAESEEIASEVVVLDCGGGNIDWSYLRRTGDGFDIVADCPPGGDRRLGGHDVDLELLNCVQDTLTEKDIEEIEDNRFYYLQQVRALKECYCRGLPLYGIVVKDTQVQPSEDDIKEILQTRFINQAVLCLKTYLDKITQIESGANPKVLLVGGSGQIRGLKQAIETQCDCETLQWERSEFATVLGAVSPPGLEAVKRSAARAKGRTERQASLPEKTKLGTIFQDKLKDSTLGPKMVVVPEGRFQMGSPSSESGRRDNEDPRHWVTISEPFAMGRHAVTFEEYDRFCVVTGWRKPYDNGWGRDGRPVINVSWDDAIAYCEWLSEQTGEQYLLPTEAQWEYTCRASSETVYCFGDDEQRLGEYAWYWKNSAGGTHPVGQKRANDWGLYDMYGNVWEWVRDWYADYSKETQQNPSGPGQGSDRVIRGGSWGGDAGNCRSACRDGHDPGYRDDDLGFRLARRV